MPQTIAARRSARTRKPLAATRASKLPSLRGGIERFAQAAFAETADPDQAANLVLSEVTHTLNRLATNAGAGAVMSAIEMKARMRGFSRHREMLQSAGGTCSADEAARRMAMSKPAVLERAAKGRLLALRGTKQNAVLFPVFQFADSPDGLVPGFQQVMLELGAQPALDSWAKCNFLLSPRDTLDGKAPIDLLRQGKVEAVVALAGTYANN